MWSLTGHEHSEVRKVIAMGHRYKTTGTRQTWMGIIVVLAALLLASAGPSHAWRGHGGVHRGFHGGFHRFGGPRIGIGIGIGPFWAPYWAPYAYPYAYPPVVIAPPAQVYVQPSPPVAAQPPPPVSWYYCDHPQGYYPYVQQCPGGWRQVPVTPQ
jgi:hypothetical protein